jgi:hypothetical protein
MAPDSITAKRTIRRSRTIAALALLVLLVLPSVASAYSFSPTSAWDRPLSTTAPTVSNSTALVGELNRQVAASGTYINTTQWSTPVYTVAAGQPTVKVKLDASYAPLQQQFLQVPIPSGATAAKGTDRHLVIRQPSTNTMWEFWKASKLADGWHASWGGKMTSVSSNPGYFTGNLGATATSLPLLGGLMSRPELEAGQINHALALAIPAAKKGVAVWPAQRTDGSSTAANAIPEGTRFRVDPKLNVEALAVKPALKAMIRAAQRYGIIIRDQSGSVAFFAEDPTPWGALNPYPGIFGAKYMDGLNALNGFPWSRLQAVVPNATAFA